RVEAEVASYAVRREGEVAQVAVAHRVEFLDGDIEECIEPPERIRGHCQAVAQRTHAAETRGAGGEAAGGVRAERGDVQVGASGGGAEGGERRGLGGAARVRALKRGKVRAALPGPVAEPYGGEVLAGYVDQGIDLAQRRRQGNLGHAAAGGAQQRD